METKQVIKILNKLLKGQYMGIHFYEHYIEKLSSASQIRDHFIQIQKDLKYHASLLSERIQHLEGHPETSEGLVGKMELFMSEVFDKPHDEKEILKHAIKGQNLYGIKMTEELVRDKLDTKSLQLVHKILEKQREHVDYLKAKLNTFDIQEN